MGRWRWHIVIFARFLWRSSRQWRVSQLRVGPRVGPWVPHRRCSLRQSKNHCTKTKQIKRWDVCSLEQNCIDSETSLFDMIHQLRFERAIHIALTILCVKIIFHQTSLSCIKFRSWRLVDPIQLAPLVGDLSKNAASWWRRVMQATTDKYSEWLYADPLARLKNYRPRKLQDLWGL
jgi:hypothetical protein